MMAGGLRLPDCQECGGKTTQRGGTIYCPECRKTVAAPIDTVVKTLGMSEAELIVELAEALARSGSLVEHEGSIFFATKGGLTTLDDASDMIAEELQVIEQKKDKDTGETYMTKERHLKSRELFLLKGKLRKQKDVVVPHADMVIPRPVLWVNAEGGLTPSKRGFNGRLVQTGKDVEPRDTGMWSRLLDMTNFQDDEARRTYEAVAMTAILPLEIDLYPLVIVHANHNSAGKTWLARIIAWMLGYSSTAKLPVNGGDIGRGIDRAIVGGLKHSRCLILDNLTGSDNSIIQDNELSDALTMEQHQAKAMYRNGTEAVRGRPIFWATLNRGVVAEDLTSRAVSIKLIKSDDPAEDPKERAKSEVGELYWRRPDVAEAVLAELMWRTMRRWDETRDWVCPGAVRRPQTWHKLAWRLTGAEVPEVASEIRMFGTVERDWLRRMLADGRTAGELAEAFAEGGGTGQQGRKLMRLGQDGPAAVGKAMHVLLKEGWPLAKRKTKRGAVWSWAS